MQYVKMQVSLLSMPLVKFDISIKRAKKQKKLHCISKHFHNRGNIYNVFHYNTCIVIHSIIIKTLLTQLQKTLEFSVLSKMYEGTLMVAFHIHVVSSIFNNYKIFLDYQCVALSYTHHNPCEIYKFPKLSVLFMICGSNIDDASMYYNCIARTKQHNSLELLVLYKMYGAMLRVSSST